MTLPPMTEDVLDILCQMVFSRKICFERHLMSGAPYLAWLLTQEDTLRLSPLEGCSEGSGEPGMDLAACHSSGRGRAGLPCRSPRELAVSCRALVLLSGFAHR